MLIYIIVYSIISIVMFFVMISINYKEVLNWNYNDKKLLIWLLIIVGTVFSPIVLVHAIILKIIKYVRNKNQANWTEYKHCTVQCSQSKIIKIIVNFGLFLLYIGFDNGKYIKIYWRNAKISKIK